jgi:hypothetical protein
MNKPENVRLEVFKFSLNPRKTYTGVNTFRDLLIKKMSSNPSIPNEELFTNFFNFFITKLDTEYKVVRNKAFTLINDNNQTNYQSTNSIIYGVLEGGPLGEGKTRRTLNNKTDANSLNGNVINDKYFFYIHTPLNSNYGYIMFQIYQQDSIRFEFFNFLFNDIFKFTPEYNMPNFDAYIPQNIKEEFKNGSKIKELKFSETMLSNQIEQSASFMSINESYKIEVTVTPIRGNVGFTLLDALIPPFISKKFSGITLGNFDNKKVVLQNGITKKSATFEMDGAGDIMPRIYLLNRIDISSFGVPDFPQLKVFCDSILTSILEEQPTVTEV